MPPLLEVFARFLRLGLTAFGGPIAHLGYFRREFVERAKWLEDEAFAEIVALCTALPGPTSSQVGILLGTLRAGPLGGLAAWIGFTLPSALALAIVGHSVTVFARIVDELACKGCRTHEPLVIFLNAHRPVLGAILGVFISLSLFATAVVLLAVISLYRSLVISTFTRIAAVIAFGSALLALTYGPNLLWLALVPGALLGARFGPVKALAALPKAFRVSRSTGSICAATLLAIFAALPLLPASENRSLFAATLRAGSLVFGGGHVVLAFLAPLDFDHARITPSAFTWGYGIVQAVPGPLFTFATFLGAADRLATNPWVAAIVATIGIFLPSFLLLPAALALWSGVRKYPRSGAILTSLGASVVGLLAATFVVVFCFDASAYAQPICGAVCFESFALLAWARLPAWAALVVTLCGSALYGAVSVALRFPDNLRFF